MNATTKRFLRIIIDFEDGKGAIRVQVGREVDYYHVRRQAENKDAILFLKEVGRDFVDHFVDLDMHCCDCAGWKYRKKCRHVDAAAVLRQRGHL